MSGSDENLIIDAARSLQEQDLHPINRALATSIIATNESNMPQIERNGKINLWAGITCLAFACTYAGILTLGKGDALSGFGIDSLQGTAFDYFANIFIYAAGIGSLGYSLSRLYRSCLERTTLKVMRGVLNRGNVVVTIHKDE